MRTLVCLAGIVVVVCIGYFLFGSHVSQWMRDAKDAVTDSTSDAHIEGIVGGALGKADSELKQRYAAVYNVNTEVVKLESMLKAQREKLEREERILKKAQELLEKSSAGSTVTIGKVAYTFEQVNDDVLKRVGTCKALRTSIQNNEQSLSKLRKAHADGLESIRQKKDELRRKQMEFEAEKAELAALRAQEYVNEVIGKIYTAADIKTELGEARQAFERRLNSLRANAEYDQSIGLASEGVSSWNAELGIPTTTALDEIKSYFKSESAAPQGEGAPPAEKKPVREALEELDKKE